jgi:hypothetical protein
VLRLCAACSDPKSADCPPNELSLSPRASRRHPLVSQPPSTSQACLPVRLVLVASHTKSLATRYIHPTPTPHSESLLSNPWCARAVGLDARRVHADNVISTPRTPQREGTDVRSHRDGIFRTDTRRRRCRCSRNRSPFPSPSRPRSRRPQQPSRHRSCTTTTSRPGTPTTITARSRADGPPAPNGDSRVACSARSDVEKVSSASDYALRAVADVQARSCECWDCDRSPPRLTRTPISPAGAMLLTVADNSTEASTSKSSGETYTSTAIWWLQDGWAGACGTDIR